MLSRLLSTLPLIFILSFPLSIFATIITPPTTMETMVSNADYIVYGTMISHVDEFGYINNFKISDPLKGNFKENQVIQVKEYSQNTGVMTSTISGDVDFEMGKNYLLFLFQDGLGYYRAEMMALSVYKEIAIEGALALTHTQELLDICFTDVPDAEFRTGYNQKSFLSSLKNSVSKKKAWNMSDAGVWNGQEPQPSQSQFAGTPPSHCTLVIGNYSQLATTCSNNSPARYDNPVFTVKVASGASSDPSITTEIANLTNAVNEMNNISGISVSLASPLVQTCSTAGCSDISSVASACTSGSGNDIWVFFDDPCNQIGALSGCTGTVGYGGTFAWNAPTCHADGCGNLWRDALIPFYVMNDGAGCLGDYKYTSLIIHEMLHSLNIGHITGTCTAIMNPSICNSNVTTNEPNFGITQLDKDCIEWMYDISNNPCNSTCSLSNVQVTSGPTCNGSNINVGVQFDATNGSGNYTIEINGVTVSTVSGAVNGTISTTVSNASVASGNATITVTDDNDSSCTASTTVTVPNCSPCSISSVQVTSGPTCNGPNINMGLSFNVANGSGSYIVRVNGVNVSSISAATSGTISANLTNISVAVGAGTITIVDNNTSSCTASSSSTFPNCSGTPCLLNANEVAVAYTSNTYKLVVNEITSSSCTVSPTVDVTYDAGTYILLTDFVATQNSTFTAIIAGCTP